MTRVGKIARLPDAIREELNKRLCDGQPGRLILPWLNGLPEVQTLLQSDFLGKPICPQNLSAWRNGGYADWLRQRKILERFGELAIVGAEMAEAAGGRIAEGACALAAARILEILYASDKMDSAVLHDVVKQHAKLRNVEIARQRMENARVRLAQSREALRFKKGAFDLEIVERLRQEKVLVPAATMEKLLADAGIERVPRQPVSPCGEWRGKTNDPPSTRHPKPLRLVRLRRTSDFGAKTAFEIFLAQHGFRRRTDPASPPTSPTPEPPDSSQFKADQGS